MNDTTRSPTGVSSSAVVGPRWWHRLIYRLYRWSWNPIFESRPELAAPIAHELQTHAVSRLGWDRYTECLKAWENIKSQPRK